VLRWFNRRFFVGLVVAGSFVAGSSSSLDAAVPTDQLLPNTTKGVVLIPNFDVLESQFNKTQLGQLMADPVMRPFAEDLEQQLRDKWSKTHDRLGLAWDDLRPVPSGEIGMGMIQVSPTKGVSVIVVDVTDKLQEADELLGKVDANLKGKNATLATKQMGGLEVLVYTHPKKNAETPAETAVFALHREQQQLIATDDIDEMRKMLGRYSGQANDRLADLKAYQFTMSRCASEAGDLAPELRWFVEPFGYVEAIRARNSDKPRKGMDMHAILKAEGFDAIQGVGGYVNFYDGSHDILHRTMIYAPAVVRKEGDTSTDKYNLAARMLKFINGNNHQPPTWVPRQLATFSSFNADLRSAFEYSKTLVNRMANDPIFEDVLESLEKDPSGPQINIREGLVAHLGEHVMIATNYELPITPKSEQLAIMIEVTDTEAVKKTINKLMESDPNAVSKIIGVGENQHILWNVVEEETELEGLELEFNFDEIEVVEDEEVKKKEEKALPTSAMAVAHGYLLTGTHPELIESMLVEADKRVTLAGSIDYQMVQTALNNLGANQVCARTFSRTDEEYRPTYELMRQGKMPESDTMMGKLLNQMFGDDEDDEKVREQQIDGSKLPEFQIVRRYLGPAGIFVESEEEGWFATGVFLSRVAPQIVKRNER